MPSFIRGLPILMILYNFFPVSNIGFFLVIEVFTCINEKIILLKFATNNTIIIIIITTTTTIIIIIIIIITTDQRAKVSNRGLDI